MPNDVTMDTHRTHTAAHDANKWCYMYVSQQQPWLVLPNPTDSIRMQSDPCWFFFFAVKY